MQTLSMRPRSFSQPASILGYVDCAVRGVALVRREPMVVVEHPNGTLFVVGYGEPRPTL